MLQSYKLFFLLALAVLIVVVACLNFTVLSFYPLVIPFLFIAVLAILPAKKLSFSEMLSFSAYTLSSIGALLSQEMVLTIIFCELMSISAFFIIAAGCKDSGPAIRYACVHFFIGLLLMVGEVFEGLKGIYPLGNTYLIVSLLMNCACFPCSFWVADAYQAASLHGTSYLSIFTTKISFLIILSYNLFQYHAQLLTIMGIFTAVYGIILASLERNVRRFLCYSIVGQMGMLIMEAGLLSSSKHAIPLLVVHVIFSLVYQLLLFSIANSIILETKAVNFNRDSPILSINGICATIAVLTMAAFPGTIGFISKSYIVAEIDGSTLTIALFKVLHLLLYASVGLKFLCYTFVLKNQSKFLTAYSGNISIIILTLICIIVGNPYLSIYDKRSIFSLVYNTQNVLVQSGLLICTTLLFIPLRKLFVPKINFQMDLDWVFRALIPHIIFLFYKLVIVVKAKFIDLKQNLTNLFTYLYLNNITQIRNILYYDSVSFIANTSLVVTVILLVLLCLNY